MVRCTTNAPAKCRSFNYANNKCDLLFVGPPSMDLPASQMDSDYYELRCVDRPAACTSPPSIDYNMAQGGTPTTSVPGTTSPQGCLSACMKDSTFVFILYHSGYRMIQVYGCELPVHDGQMWSVRRNGRGGRVA
jgi:hypothetical protein